MEQFKTQFLKSGIIKNVFDDSTNIYHFTPMPSFKKQTVKTIPNP